MISRSIVANLLPLAALCATFLPGRAVSEGQGASTLQISVDRKDGSYTIGAKGLAEPVLHGGVAVKADGHWLQSSAYPRYDVQERTIDTPFGAAKEWNITGSGLANAPQISYQILSYAQLPFGEIRVTVFNATRQAIHVEAIRMLEGTGASILNLGGPADQDRVLSDSFSEDVPPIKIRELLDAENSMHRGVGSQLIYNRKSHWSFFAGTLSTERFLTLLRIHLDKANSISAFEAEAAGTTEITEENSLSESPKEDRVSLSLPVMPGAEIQSERLVFSAGTDYHQQLETYGAMVKQIYHARTTAPSLMGWWSWTAFYYGLNEAALQTNAQWLSQNLSPLGYTMFHLDEGYQYARGEYTTPDAALFPNGVVPLERKIQQMGLTSGIWTAPFEVSERSVIYLEHPEWLIHNSSHQPIHLGWANNHRDRLYALDTTHPAAQQYLRDTYRTLVRDWGIRYIKLDFMDDSGIEGIRYRPDTTAMEAQRIGLEIIRSTVGDDVLLDKDGSTMLNPVGYVDYGRTGQDTGHTFIASKEAAPAIAARYYMHRNFFVNDPDAFTVSTQTIKDHPWNGGKVPLTLDEARVSIALSAISGGMFEIGDDLPTLGQSPERLALVKNKDLLDMVKLGKASTPVDLMTFGADDQQPSLFLLKEDERQSIVTIFNWTDSARSRTIELSSLGLRVGSTYALSDVLADTHQAIRDTVSVQLPAHSVRMLKVEDLHAAIKTPEVQIHCPSEVVTGKPVHLSADAQHDAEPVIRYEWSFGDGTSADGNDTTHTYTQPGTYTVTLEATGVNGKSARSSTAVTAVGSIPSVFVPENKKRFKE